MRVRLVWRRGGVEGRGRGGEGVVVQSNSPRPPRRQHREGTPFLVSSETSGRLQQRDNAAGGWEESTLHRGGSNGVSCARDDRRQVSFPAGELLNRLVGDMKHDSVLGGCMPRPPPGEKTSHEETLGFGRGYDDGGAE